MFCREQGGKVSIMYESNKDYESIEEATNLDKDSNSYKDESLVEGMCLFCINKKGNTAPLLVSTPLMIPRLRRRSKVCL